MTVINTDILRNPINWFTIAAMAALVIMSGVVIYSRLKRTAGEALPSVPSES